MFSPGFLASLGRLSRVELHHCCVVDLFGVWTGPKDLWVGHRISWGIYPHPRFLASLFLQKSTMKTSLRIGM
jgi:hypothetical protein